MGILLKLDVAIYCSFIAALSLKPSELVALYKALFSITSDRTFSFRKLSGLIGVFPIQYSVFSSCRALLTMVVPSYGVIIGTEGWPEAIGGRQY